MEERGGRGAERLSFDSGIAFAQGAEGRRRCRPKVEGMGAVNPLDGLRLLQQGTWDSAHISGRAGGCDAAGLLTAWHRAHG